MTTKDNLKFVLAIALSCVALTAITISAVRVGEISGDTVTETLLTVVPFGSIGAIIVIILLFVAVCDEQDAARHRNQLPKRSPPLRLEERATGRQKEKC